MARSPLMLFSIGLLASLATPTHAQDCTLAPDVSSYSSTEIGPPDDDGPFSGHPARSSLSSGFTGDGYNVSGEAGLTMDQGWFATRVRVGGDLAIRPFASNGGGASTIGNVFDCLLIDGYQGGGRLHVPIRLTGGTLVSWTIGGVYVPPAGLDPAVARTTILCAANAGNTLLPCDDPSFVWDASAAIDTTVELVVPFTFGTGFALQYGPRASTAVGYAASGSEGFLSGTAWLDLEGRLEPASVRDLGGNLLPDATITTLSGFDFLHPIPETDASASAIAALAALAARRRR
jgi:hypothetical protein